LQGGIVQSQPAVPQPQLQLQLPSVAVPQARSAAGGRLRATAAKHYTPTQGCPRTQARAGSVRCHRRMQRRRGQLLILPFSPPIREPSGQMGAMEGWIQSIFDSLRRFCWLPGSPQTLQPRHQSVCKGPIGFAIPRCHIQTISIVSSPVSHQTLQHGMQQQQHCLHPPMT
jgi:hypothetical protein